MTAGRFLTLEGGEGAGKSTQAKALAAALRTRGLSVALTREPGGSAGAEEIRDLLMRGQAARWSAHSEALLFAAARGDHVDKVINPALASGEWVICDRFIDSSRAYQGAAGGIGDAAILALHAFGSRGMLPDRTLVLEVPTAMGRARAAARDGSGDADRFAQRDHGFHESVVQAFRDYAAADPARVRLIDATRSPDDVTGRLLAEIADLLP